MRKACSETVVLLALLLFSTITKEQTRFVLGCHELEREALLKFKLSVISDSAEQLSSWKGQNCCSWQGITCYNVSRRVLGLDLSTNNGIIHFSNLNPSLLQLKELSYLDLSRNNFNMSRIPDFIGSMNNLRYLNFSEANFGGSFPPQLGKLTRLLSLDLGNNGLKADNLQLLSKLVNVRFLDISNSQINNFDALPSLPSLIDLRLTNTALDTQSRDSLSRILHSLTWKSAIQHLDLSRNYLEGSFPQFLANMTLLEYLDLSGNFFEGPIPHFLASMSSLKYLDLSYNNLIGSVPLWLRNIRGLEVLKLGGNFLSHVEGGSITGILRNLCNLKVFDISDNEELVGDILHPYYYENLTSMCITSELEYLDLSFCNVRSTLPYWLGDLVNLKTLNLAGNRFDGPIPPSIGNLSSLEKLHLSNCGLNGSIPPSIGSMSSLKTLDLSSNSLEGFVSDSHLTNLSKLKVLYLSLNPLNLKFSSNWLPKFQLSEFRMSSCWIKGNFPRWMETQNELTVLDISNNQIHGELPMEFPGVTLTELNLSHNQITGPIPHFPSQISTIDLSYNTLSSSLLYDQSDPKGIANASLCELISLQFLDLQQNQFSGEIPDCWGRSENLFALDLSSNKLTGTIPMSIGLLEGLQYLKLNNNSLEGTIPTSLKNLSQLMILDLGENKLTGEVPHWSAKTHPSLTVLRLRSNHLKGIIPEGLCSLFSLKFLDLAQNNLTGNIPKCFGNCTSMKSGSYVLEWDDSNPPPVLDSPAPVSEDSANDQDSAMVVFKGAERQYTSTLKFVVDLDLSCNRLTGSIPEELVQLTSINGLNLSYNLLTGRIPEKIGDLVSLESLDLSNNDLLGTIPSSLSAMTSLSSLNLSSNKLHGEIPTGNQLQTLDDPSIYAHNAGLCGAPLPPCGRNHGNGKQQEQVEEDGESKLEKVLFYLVVMLGFATGFWGVVGSLLLKKPWRHALFRRLETFTDFLYVQVVVRIKRIRG